MLCRICFRTRWQRSWKLCAFELWRGTEFIGTGKLQIRIRFLIWTWVMKLRSLFNWLSFAHCRLQLHWLWLKLHMNLNTEICTGLVTLESICAIVPANGLANSWSCICYRGNILLSRKDSETLKFTLEGKHMFVRTFGLLISIIDFTLSRINTGEIFLTFNCDNLVG